MGLFDIFQKTNINKGVNDFMSTQGAMLIDVRSSEEYKGGHIPQSINIPLDKLAEINKRIPDKNTHIFSYCLSGARSARAVDFMKSMGYVNAINIGGISSYKGAVETDR